MNTMPAYTRRQSIISSCPQCPFKAATTQKDERPRRSTTSNLPSLSSRHENSRTMNKTIDYSEWDKAMNIYCNAREDEKIPTNTPSSNQHCLDVVVDKRLPSRRRSSVTALTLSMSTESSIETSVLLDARRQVAQEEDNGYYIYTCDDDSCISSLQDSICPKKKGEEDLDWERLESFMDNDFLNDDNIEECYDALIHLHKVYKEKNEKKNNMMKSSAALHRRPVFASPQVEQYRVGRRCPAA